MSDQSSIDRLLEWATAKRLLIVFIMWLLVPSVVYCIFTPDGVSESSEVDVGLVRSDGKGSAPGLGSAFYFSAVTAATLGYGDIIPVGWLRFVACLQSFGGVLLAGVAVAAVCNISTKRTELVKRKLCGQWIQKVTHHKVEKNEIAGSVEYVLMNVFVDFSGNVKFDEVDFDYESGEFKESTYEGVLVSNNYPEFFFRYEARTRGKYTKGLESIKLVYTSSPDSVQFEAYCYDTENGQFDDIRGVRVGMLSSRDGTEFKGGKTASELKSLIKKHFSPPETFGAASVADDHRDEGERRVSATSDAGASDATMVEETPQVARRRDLARTDSESRSNEDYGLELIIDLRDCQFGELSEQLFHSFF